MVAEQVLYRSEDIGLHKWMSFIELRQQQYCIHMRVIVILLICWHTALCCFDVYMLGS